MKLPGTIDEACCVPLMREPLSQLSAERMAAAFRVLADPARLRLLSLIATHEGAEACVCDLTGPLDLSQPTVSHHLKVLMGAGLLERERRGRMANFRVLPEPLELLRGVLAAPVAAKR
jgi:ArsR family transcriptional regulator